MCWTHSIVPLLIAAMAKDTFWTRIAFIAGHELYKVAIILLFSIQFPEIEATSLYIAPHCYYNLSSSEVSLLAC